MHEYNTDQYTCPRALNLDVHNDNRNSLDGRTKPLNLLIQCVLLCALFIMEKVHTV